jgi:hypothetical protein
MSVLIRELFIPNELGDTYQTPAHGNRLTKLSKLNVFIGPNNAGKSRLLRGIFSAELLQVSPAVPSLEQFRASIADISVTLAEPIPPQDNFLTLSVRDSLQKVYAPMAKSSHESRWEGWRPFVSAVINAESRRAELSPEGKELFSKCVDLRKLCDRLHQADIPDVNATRIYIPALRGLRPLTENGTSLYYDRTNKDYFGNRPWARSTTSMPRLMESSIVTGLEFYAEVTKHLLGTVPERQSVRDYERFLERHFFDGEQVSLTPRFGDDVLHIKIGDDRERPIFHLGDGLQQVIILTLPLFLHRDKDLFLFIEEPELYLHPGFQRTFINAVLEDTDCKGRQVFIATHSHQFLDITLDATEVSIYRLTKLTGEGDATGKDSRFQILNWSNEDFSLLQELGIRNSSILLSNCTIWVEGITDRMYIRTYLDILQAERKTAFQEDIHFSFVEYGGGNITHWSFCGSGEDVIAAERICPKIFLVADRDEGKEQRHAMLKESLGQNFYQLQVREVENLLTPQVLQHVIDRYEKGGVTLKGVQQGDYAEPYLGEFIELTMLPPGYKSVRQRKENRPYADKSGTLKDKVGFARFAVEEIKRIGDMSSEARALAEAILSFIERSNK